MGDLVTKESPLFGIVWINPQRLSGAPCFYGTRVPVQNLFDYLRAGRTVEVFTDDFPGVTATQVRAVLDLAEARLLHPGRAA